MFTLRVDDETQLRLLELDHAEELHNLVDANRDYLRQWMPWLNGSTDAASQTGFIGRMRRQYEDRTGFTTGLWHGGRLAGVIGYNTLDWENRHGAMGYWLGAEYQGRGLMTKSCAALTTMGFDELGLNRVEIRCAVGNAKSRAIPTRLGFVEEGTIRDAEWLYDHFVDLVVYGMLAREWGSSAPNAALPAR